MSSIYLHIVTMSVSSVVHSNINKIEQFLSRLILTFFTNKENRMNGFVQSVAGRREMHVSFTHTQKYTVKWGQLICYIKNPFVKFFIVRGKINMVSLFIFRVGIRRVECRKEVYAGYSEFCSMRDCDYVIRMRYAGMHSALYCYENVEMLWFYCENRYRKYTWISSNFTVYFNYRISYILEIWFNIIFSCGHNM